VEAVKQDVVIVGAGPAGSALAIGLAGSGMKVLLADAASFPRDKPCGDYVNPKGVRHLIELGCREQISGIESVPITRSKLYLNSDLLVTNESPLMGRDPEYGLALPRRDLDSILLQHATARGADVLENFRVSGFDKQDGFIRVSGELNDKHVSTTTRLVVGADGVSSTIAKITGMANEDPRYTSLSLRAYVHGLSLPHALMFFDERFFPGYGWVTPVRDGLCNIGVTITKEPIARDGIHLLEFYQQFKLLVQRLAQARGETIEFGEPLESPISNYGGAKENYFDGGLLIGEAGCFVDPINGEGIPLALESAKLAAATIRHAFETGDFSLASLAAYEKSWRDMFDADLGISDLLSSLMRNRGMSHIWLSALRTMSQTAKRDKKYADATGGFIRGMVSAREAFSPDMIGRVLVDMPNLWREYFSTKNASDIPQMLQHGERFLSWQSSIAGQIFATDSWSRDWALEIAAKQANVVLNSKLGVQRA
jgi:menaquinone-9 beta-reductase